MAYNNNQTPSPRFYLDNPKGGYYEAGDMKTGVFVTFEEKKFQETQEWHLPCNPDLINKPSAVGHIQDKIEGWLRMHHAEIMSQPLSHSLTKSEDGTITLARPEIGLTITFPASLGRATAAAFIRTASVWLKNQSAYLSDVDF